MKRTITIGLALLSAAACAQNAPAPRQTPAQTPGQTPKDKPNVVVLSQGKTIAQAAADWSRAANATVVMDPSIVGTVTPATARLSLEPGLTAVAKAQHADWQKAFLRPADIPKKADGQVDFEKLRAIVESAASVPNVSVGVLDPDTGMISMSTRVPANAASTQEWLKDRQAIYILYRPAIIGSAVGRPGSDPVADYVATQKNSLDSFRSMTPEQRAEAMRQGMDMFMNMDPKVMMEMTRESMAALQSLTPEQKAKLVDLSMQMMGGQNAPGQGAPPAAPGH